MTVLGAPYHARGNVVAGAGRTCRGDVYGVGPAAGDGTLVRGEYKIAVLDGVVTNDTVRQEVYADGTYSGVAEPVPASESSAPTGGRFVLPGVASGDRVDVDVVARTRVEHVQDAGGSPFPRASVSGSTVVLEWTASDDVDFARYRIWWDEGDAGGGVDHLLATLTAREVTAWRSSALDDGTYRFAISLVDHVGNESSVGTPVSVAVVGVPVAVSGLAVSYNATTRAATLTWTPPAGQRADVTCYLVMDNWRPEAGSDPGLADHANTDGHLRRGVDYNLSGEQTWDSGELWAGLWRWKICAMNTLGVLGDCNEATLNLALNGSTLEQVSDPPATPVVEDVWPLADGAFGVRVALATTTGVTALWVLEDGAETEEITVVAGQLYYTYETGSHADAQTIAVGARVYAGTLYADSDTMDVLTDAAAPTGSTVVTARVC